MEKLCRSHVLESVVFTFNLMEDFDVLLVLITIVNKYNINQEIVAISFHNYTIAMFVHSYQATILKPS